MPMFDAHVMVDWSSRSAPTRLKPSKDAIWVGTLGAAASPQETYHRTRADATDHVRALLRAHVETARRVLVGFDFPYGYPAGFAAAVDPDAGADPWRRVWDHLTASIEDSPSNANNRFAVASEINRRIGSVPGPFWACPVSKANVHLSSKRGYTYPFAHRDGTLRMFRATESALPGVQETWRLGGAGSVGSQALVGIPRVHSLRFDPDLRDVSRVWPFETGLTTEPAPTAGPWIVHAEIWPGIVPAADVEAEMQTTGAIRDQAQVRLMCRWARDHDAAGTLGAWFGPGAVGTADPEAVVREEGWILGGPPLA